MNTKSKFDGRTPLHESVLTDDKEIVELLLTQGAEVNTVDLTLGRTPLHDAVVEGCKEIVELLLSHRADVNIADKANGRTPLQAAVVEGNKEIVKLLLRHKADVNIASKNDGRTALHDAVLTGSKEVAELLLSHGAVVNTVDLTLGRTPLHDAVVKGFIEIVELLLRHRAVVNTVDSANGRTPLHAAVVEKNKEIVNLLISHGAKMKLEDGSENTLLRAGAERAHKEKDEILLKEQGGTKVKDKSQFDRNGSHCSQEMSATSETDNLLAEMTDQLDLDDDEIRNCIRETFVKHVIPENITWLFHKYDEMVLTENDLQRIRARTCADGPMEGAKLLLYLLPSYKNWFVCLIKVLEDENVKMGHLAKKMQDKVNDLKIFKLERSKNLTRTKE